MSPNLPSPGAVSSAALFPGGPSPSTLSALVSQHRLLELSRFGLRGYDLAQHMLSQQGAVSKLLGKLGLRSELLYVRPQMRTPLQVRSFMVAKSEYTIIMRWKWFKCIHLSAPAGNI